MDWYFEVQTIKKVDNVSCGYQLWHEQPSVKQQWCPRQSRTLLSLPGVLWALTLIYRANCGVQGPSGPLGVKTGKCSTAILDPHSGGFSLIVSLLSWYELVSRFCLPFSFSLFPFPGDLILTSLNKGGWDPGCLQIQGPEKHLLRTSWENGAIACCPDKPWIHIATNYYSNVKIMEEKPSNQTQCIKWKEIFMLR